MWEVFLNVLAFGGAFLVGLLVLCIAVILVMSIIQHIKNNWKK